MRAAPAVVGFSCIWHQLLLEPVMRDYSEDINNSLGRFFLVSSVLPRL